MKVTVKVTGVDMAACGRYAPGCVGARSLFCKALVCLPNQMECVRAVGRQLLAPRRATYLVTAGSVSCNIDQCSTHLQPSLSTAMEGLGVAASVLGVVELSAKVASLCLQYSKAVKHAKDDIFRLHKQVTELESILASVTHLLDSPNGSQLKASQQLRAAVLDAESQLQGLHALLCPNTGRQTMSRWGLRSLTWPLQDKDAEKFMETLGRCTQAISLALQIEQT